MRSPTVRVSDDKYIKSKDFIINGDEIQSIQRILKNRMVDGYVSLINFDDWEELPVLSYEWNVFLLRSIVDRYLECFRIIETKAKDRRYERGIIIDRESTIEDYSDFVARYLRAKGYIEVAENKMLSLLILNNLTYKLIPKELYSSDKIIYANEVFRLD